VHAGSDEGSTNVLSAKFPGQLLHDLVAEALGAGEHRKLVAAERPVAEHVDQAELCLHD
jgi:hypothetical protein